MNTQNRYQHGQGGYTLNRRKYCQEDDYNHKNYIELHLNMQLKIEQVKIQASKRRRSEKTVKNSEHGNG
jgi:hypothetical protein